MESPELYLQRGLKIHTEILMPRLLFGKKKIEKRKKKPKKEKHLTNSVGSCVYVKAIVAVIFREGTLFL